MAEPYLGEIRMMGFDFNPKKWAKCDGQILQINDYPALYALLSTHFGGNGVNTFGLPDLRGRVPVGSGELGGSYYPLGSYYGQEGVALDVNTLATHNHSLNVTNEQANSAKASDKKVFAQNLSGPGKIYGNADNLTNLNVDIVSEEGGGLPHYNMQPAQVINFCIALDGIFPSRN